MPTSPPVAIVGMSSLFAGSHDVIGFWRDIISATDRITDVPPTHWLIDDYYDPDPTAPDMTYSKRGGYLDPIAFNPMEFGLPPKTIPSTDSAQLLALIAAKRVLADAGRFHDGDVDHSRTSVILGVASATELTVQLGSRLQHPIWRKALREAGLPESKVQEIVQRIKDHYQPWQESSFPGLLGNVIAGRIANRLDLGGSNFVTDAACGSSMAAMQAGLAELYLGDSDMVIVGGVDALNDILMYMCFSKTPAFSPTGDCRPFSEEADGTLIGEGTGMLALRRLEDAEADGDRIYAVVRGLGASSDGKGSSVYAPRPAGQANALLRAYEKADYSPATVELVEAHGTATKAGDAAEVVGLTSVFAPANEDARAWCALGSVKSQIGHTKAAAGSAGLIKVALALHHKILPPTIKVSKPSEKLGLGEGPMYINTEARPWIRGDDHPRRGSVSAFGFGGSNFHVALEEYVGPGLRPDRLRTWSEELVVVSAGSPAELSEALTALQERIEAGAPLGLIAHDCAESFEASAQARVALVAGSVDELAGKAVRAAKAIVEDTTDSLPDADIAFGFGAPAAGKVAFVFPGQGSQYVGMGGAAAMAFDSVREVWDDAASMQTFVGDRLDRAVFPPPAFSDEQRAEQQRRVTEMATAQPAIAAVSLGYLSLLARIGLTPDAVAGHSFGELSALAAAGRIDPSELLATARRRGELMAEAADSQAGAMVAVASDAATVSGLLEDDSGVVIANDNAPTEVVLAGSVEAIEAISRKLKGQGLTTIRLPVASAFHSSIVADSCEPFHEYLASVKWSAGEVDVYANTSAKVYPKTAKSARRLLADQLASPVRFREMVEAMYDAGVTHFVEVGPGRVLTKLVGRCLGDRAHVAVSLDDRKVEGLRALWRGVGKLAAEGFDLNLSALADGYSVPEAPAAPHPFEIMINGANHDKPYPPANGAAGLPDPNPEVAELVVTLAAATPAPMAVSASGPVSAPAPKIAPLAPAASTTEPSGVHGASEGVAMAPQVAQPPVDAAMTVQLHQVTIEAHRRYQELMAESHRSFLSMASSALAQITGAPLPQGTPVGVQVPIATPVPAAPQMVPVPVVSTPAVSRPAVAAEATTAPERAVPSEYAVPVGPAAPVEPVAVGAPEPVAAPASPPEVAAAATASVPAVDITALALEVVSEKTGYPVEMLDLDMEMEAGLGIDSIKQVEILSELQERLPGIQEIAPSELATLRTLRDVAEKLMAGMPAVSTSVAAPTGSPEAVGAEPASVPAVDITALALEVVSEKTGYPVEMLDLDMEMEAGLGIDSIKQVEILSELQERLPGIQEIAPSELATLRTLRDVAEKLMAGMPAASESVVAAATTGTPSVVGEVPASAPAVDVTALALEVVAEKTGYPVEMLDLDMEMEAGLGIDSIKQVEILSELQERLPGVPEIAPSELASLCTLRDVAEKLMAGMPALDTPVVATASASTPEVADVAPVSDETVDVTALALEVVAEKTGYPIEMLDLDMEMEAGLGIDSIKQVEILSALQERLPGVPEIAPSELASLRTLRDVANKLQPSGGTPTAETTAVIPSIVEVSEPTPVAAFVPRIRRALRPGFGLAGLSQATRIQITNELPSLATELAEGLEARGVAAQVVDAPSASAVAVISLAGLGEYAPGPEGSLAVHTKAIQAARLVAQHPVPAERMFVTVQSTGGDFGLVGDPGVGAWTGGLAGIVKTASHEWPGASLKAIDAADPATAATAILDELFLGGPTLEVGISADGERWVVEMEPLPRGGAQSPALEPGAVVVVSGGARGVTASSVAKLAEAWNVRLALLGRSKLAEWPQDVPLSTDAVQLTGALAAAAKQRGETVDLAGIQKEALALAASAEVRMSLAELDARGIEAIYLSADVTDVTQVADALTQVREKWGPIAGIVHGAGVLRDKALADITPDRVADVFGPKVTGLSVLLEATEDDPIELIALFSSIAARTGNAGQAAYSAANEVLNKVAAGEAHRRGDACRVRSYNWGPWAGGMVDAGLAAHFEKQGIALLDIDTGAQFFVDELARVGEGVERVVLASPSFPAVTHHLTVLADIEEGGSEAHRFAPALVADFALRLGQALKPVRTMRTYLEDFVIAMRETGIGPVGRLTVDILPIVAAIPGYRLIFKDDNGNQRHETMVRYSETSSGPPPSVPSGGLKPWPFQAQVAYDTVLTAGSEYRSIVDLEGVSEEGGMALLRSAASLGWSPKAFARGFDPATLEGLLQLGELWTHHKSGAIQKLSSMGTMVVHQLETMPERLRSAFRARITDKGTLFDFILATEDGDLVAELREVRFDAHGA